MVQHLVNVFGSIRHKRVASMAVTVKACSPPATARRSDLPVTVTSFKCLLAILERNGRLGGFAGVYFYGLCYGVVPNEGYHQLTRTGCQVGNGKNAMLIGGNGNCLAVSSAGRPPGRGLPSALNTTPLMAPVLSRAFAAKNMQWHRSKKATILFTTDLRALVAFYRRESIGIHGEMRIAIEIRLRKQ